MRVLIASLLLVISAASAGAKTYSAERFDSRIRILPDGTLEVTETVTFRFEDGTFDHVFREIPTRRTDDVEIVAAQMDGRPLQFGTATGQVQVTRGSKVKALWRFAPRSGSSHTFVLTYIVRGAVRREAGVDQLEWVALPTEHAYRIDSSEVIVDFPTAPSVPPEVESRRVGQSSIERSSGRVQILAKDIGRNGWVKTNVQFAAGSVIARAPVWQQRRTTANAYASRWATAAGLILALGIVLMLALRQSYDPPPRPLGVSPSSVDSPPDSLRPALAGALVSNGTVTLPHAMATLFTLADRGAITIDDEPRRWGMRNFTLHRQKTAAPLAGEEAVLLDLVFRAKGREEETVTITRTRSRVASGLRRFNAAVRQELRALGLLDDDRTQLRSRYVRVSVALLIVAAVSVVPAAILSDRYLGWPFLIVGAIGVIAVMGFIFYAGLTPLSNDGERRAERWRAFQQYLKDIARDRVRVATDPPSRLLPFAVALGLASVWSKYVKHHPTDVPVWFRTLASAGHADGFSAFIAVGGADASGHGGAGAGAGAAGGGGSGAG